MRLPKTVVTGKPLGRVFGYLSDLTTTTHWDPGTVAVGTEVTYTVEFSFKGAARYLEPLFRPALAGSGTGPKPGRARH